MVYIVYTVVRVKLYECLASDSMQTSLNGIVVAVVLVELTMVVKMNILSSQGL